MNKPENQQQFNADNTEAEDLRQKCFSILKNEGLTKAALSKESGIANGTFTNWLGDTYTGTISNINNKVKIWLASRDQQKQVALTVPVAPGYIETASALKFEQMMRFAQILPDMTLITGVPGIGKTMAARNYKANNPNVVFVGAHPGTSNANNILIAIAAEMKIEERNSTKLFRAIASNVSGNQTLIIIDECQHLKPEAMEQLRALHDNYEVGFAFLGNQSVHSVVTSGVNEGEYAQLFSRIGARCKQPKSKPEDINLLLAAWGIEDKEILKMCRLIANRAGALRVMSKVLQQAHMMASAEAVTLNKSHIEAAYSHQSNGGTH